MELKCLKKFNELPKSKEIIDFVIECRKFIFPGYFEAVNEDCEIYRKNKLLIIKYAFLKSICNDNEKASQFIDKLTSLIDVIETDVEFTYESDPAAHSYDEIILTYPGMFAISYQRIAHLLYELNIPVVPRIITEYAHSHTGIDIHPGATIGDHFFIDHGTGIVIGETTIIGTHVKIYHGVTLGALSLSAGQKLKGVKRHPTVCDYVTIYSCASILGGETIIGEHSTIGSNVFITETIPANSKVIMNKVNHEII